MGVSGLLPALKEAQTHVTLEKFHGKTLAIDAYAWLHKSVLSCSMELAQGQPTQKYINYILKRIDMLNHFQIKPFFVFDGDYLPCKKGTEVERGQKRKESHQSGMAALSRGDKKMAFQYFQKSCDVTPTMAKALIDIFKTKKINFIVAPYEADAQMVYLEREGVVDGIISEDSDLLVFGCKCLVTKLNDRGECIEVNRSSFHKVRSVPIDTFTPLQMRTMAALSGCDYTKGIPGIGVIKALQFVRKFQNMERILKAINLEGKYKIPTAFEQEWLTANLAFQYQLVFNPLTGQMTSMNPLEERLKDCDISSSIGKSFTQEIHRKIAFGEVDPIHKTVLVSREVLVSQRSFGFVSKPTPKMTSFTAPITPKVYKSIDSFFTPQRKIHSQVQTQKVVKVSPLAKRLKVFSESTECSGNSKFFAKPVETTDLQLNSSEYELSDVDINSPERKKVKPLSSDDCSDHEDVITPANPAKVRMLETPSQNGLWEKFRCSEAKLTRSPLKEQTNLKRSSVTDSFNKKMGEKLTLQDFIYKEG